MGNIRVLIAEDEPVVASDLERQLEKAGLEVSGVFESGEEIIEFLKTNKVDVILMDVRLYGSLDGIDTAHQINKSHDIPIIFLTANTDLTTFNRAKLTFPHSFLSKPFRIKDILHAIGLATDQNMDQKESKESEEGQFMADRIFIRDRDSMHKVLYDQILFIEADGAYSNIYTEQKVYTLSQTLKKIDERLQIPFLIRAHRSYIVNVLKVDRISETSLHIDNHNIPISKSYREEVLRKFNMI